MVLGIARERLLGIAAGGWIHRLGSLCNAPAFHCARRRGICKGVPASAGKFTTLRWEPRDEAGKRRRSYIDFPSIG